MKFNLLYEKIIGKIDGIKDQVYIDQMYKGTYLVPRLIQLSKDISTEKISLNDLKKQIYKDTPWEKGLTINNVLNKPNKYKTHIEDIDKSDLKYPIIIAPNGEIADGNHRLAKAVKTNKDFIKAKVFKQWEDMEVAKDTYIDFPKDEFKNLKERLNSDKNIFTTRISYELDLYKKNSILDSPFGKLKVISVFKSNNIKKHPHYSELTSKQLDQLEDEWYEYIELEKYEDKNE